MRSSKRQSLRALAGAAAVVALALVGSGAIASAAAKRSASAPSWLPASVASSYKGFNIVPVTKNPLTGYKAPKAPWKFCLAESYTGNDFRVGPPLGSDGMLKKLVAQLQKKGLASGPLQETDSNNDVATQLSQMNSLVSSGCQVIFTIPGSATGLCSAIQNGFNRGVITVSMGAETACKHTVAVDANEYQYAYLSAQNLAQRLKGKGNVVMINAIQGVPSAIASQQGAEAAFKAHPGIKVIGQIWGEWTPSVAKTQMLQFLSTHPETVNGVWQAGLMSVAATQALQQVGRPAAKVEDFAGDCAELALWHQDGGSNFAYNEAGEPYAYMAMAAAVRILRGSQPLSNVLLFDPPVISAANLAHWYSPNMNTSSTCYPNAPGNDRVKASSLNALFKSIPSDVPVLTYFTAPL